jgi:hypothetical protein
MPVKSDADLTVFRRMADLVRACAPGPGGSAEPISKGGDISGT